METQELLEYLDIPFSFQKRETPLLPQYRVIWGLSILVLILEISSYGKSSSIKRLHLLNWAIRSDENRQRMSKLIEDRSSIVSEFIKYDPGFTRAIEYAIADDLVKMKNNTKNKPIYLIEKGTKLAKEIIATKNCLEEEKTFLRQKGKLITNELAESLFELS
ncbi:MAG: hypothetical protein LH649_03800 [Pseudanabaena sp. CAN_BIN31]|nr:hypothetical protein [Pseudanabaena sp. CAN_BIN31]